MAKSNPSLAFPASEPVPGDASLYPSLAGPGRRRRPGRRAALVLLALALVAGALYAAWGYTRGRPGLVSDDLDIRLGKAEYADIQVAVNEVGTIEPVVRVDVKSTLSGRVTDLLAREGEKVRKGQVLARVEPDVNQAQTLSEVRSTLNLATIRATDADPREICKNSLEYAKRHRRDVVILGDFDPGRIETREIRDPVEQPKEVFELSYARIDRCIGEFVRAVSVSAQRTLARSPEHEYEEDGDRNARQEQTA